MDLLNPIDASRELWLRLRCERRLKRRFFKIHGHKLDVRRPQSHSEKVFCRMIDTNRRGDLMMTALSDKLRVREYVERRVGTTYLSRLLWHGKDPRSIPFDELPERYIIKANHGSRMNILVQGNLDRTSAIERMNGWLSTDYSLRNYEYQYRKIDRRILIEEVLDDGEQGGPLDYKCWCFGGKVEFVQVDDAAQTINPFFDCNWQRVPIGYRPLVREITIGRPSNLEEMIAVASQLSRGIDFVRVDLYDLKNRIVFGEMTFTPMAGHAKFNPPDCESRFGKLWHYDKRPLADRNIA